MTRRQLEQKRTADKAAFLKAYRLCGNVLEAERIAKLKPGRHQGWLRADPVYRAAFEDCKPHALNVIENAIYERAVTGVEEPVGWYKGVAGGTVRRYSDTLLIFLAKSLAPEKYRDHYTIDHNVRTYDDVVLDFAKKSGELPEDGTEPDTEPGTDDRGRGGNTLH